MDVNELRQKRAKIWEDAKKDLLDKADAEKRDLSPEEDEKYKKMMAEIDGLKRQIDREEERQRIEAEMAATTRDGGKKIETAAAGLTPEQFVEKRDLALRAWLSMGTKIEVTAEQREAAKLTGIDLGIKEIGVNLLRDYRLARKEFRDMSLTAGSGGDYIPKGFVNNLEVALLAFGGVRQAASVIRTDTGNDLPWPTINDTGNKGAILAESTTFSTSVDPTTASLTFKAFKYSSKPVLMSYELMQDSAFDLGANMGDWLGTRIARIQNDHFTTGAGTTLPKGLTVAGVVGKTAASMTTFTSDEVIDLQHSVDPSYRVNGTFMFHDTVFAFIRKFKESTTNAYMWQPGLTNGAPDRFLGRPYAINQSMASAFTTGQKLILFGDMSKYKIRDVANVRLIRLNELFAQTDQVAFIMFMRTDGNLLDAGTRPVKWLALA